MPEGTLSVILRPSDSELFDSVKQFLEVKTDGVNTEQRAKERGSWPKLQELKACSCGNGVIAWIRDPDGNNVEHWQPKARDEGRGTPMGGDFSHQRELSERAYMQAVLACKLAESNGDADEFVSELRRSCMDLLGDVDPSNRAFSLHTLRFLYKKDLVGFGWFLRRKVRNLLVSDSSEAVRLAAFDFLGARLTLTGSRSGIKASHYASILAFRESMLSDQESRGRMSGYENVGFRDDLARLSSEPFKALEEVLARLP